MVLEELTGNGQADIGEEVAVAVGELVEEGIDGGTEAGEISAERMEVDDLLPELAPELLDGIEPGRIGGQRNQLDREGQVSPGSACPRMRIG